MLTASQIIKLHIIKLVCDRNNLKLYKDEFTHDVIDEVYEDGFNGDYQDDFYEVRNELRTSGEYTNLPALSFSREYEIDVNAICIDGKWVVFDYYYGGGKHGEPEYFDWVSSARLVDCEENEVVTIERTFSFIK